MAKHRQGDPWMPSHHYGALLPPLSLNLLVAEVERSVAFYRHVLAATVHYHDEDFAALSVGGAQIMLHADHTFESHPWQAGLAAGKARGLGAQIRLLGMDPDAVERRARDSGAVVALGVADKTGHAWREVAVRDPDGYEWCVGVLIAPPPQ